LCQLWDPGLVDTARYRLSLHVMSAEVNASQRRASSRGGHEPWPVRASAASPDSLVLVSVDLVSTRSTGLADHA